MPRTSPGCLLVPLLSFLLVASWGTRQVAGQSDPIQPIKLRADDAWSRASTKLVKGSHVKVFIPSLPYLYTSHAINGALIRPAANQRGWEYDMAVDHQQIDDTTYEFQLRRGVRFQDGTPFNADAVVMNMESFKKKPVQYSKIDEVFDYVEKVDDYTVRFHLTQKYGSFMNDVIWMQFYTEEYLKRNPGGWNGKANCPNLSMPGPYGLGPYMLSEGYIEGDRQTSKAVLKANPYYWDPNYPKVETITVFTDLDSQEAKQMALYQEGQLDITIIPPEDKVETILSDYSKLVISPSTDNIAIHINMINGHPKLKDKEVRNALNEAINRHNLLHFVYENEGTLSPISPYFPGVGAVSQHLLPTPENFDPHDKEVHQRLRQLLDGLQLRVLTQDRFLPLWRGIETHFAQVGVTLDIHVTNSEKEIFQQLLTTYQGKNSEHWDLLIWGNDDWYFNHPFSVFLVFRANNAWSTLLPDPVMNGYLEEMFQATVDEPEFASICEKIMRHAYDQGYMLFVPTPNKVFAVNKEVVFHPYRMACMPLWRIEITNQHWSVRRSQQPYPQTLRRPVEISRVQIK
ncbi:peptide ABC transporter substrate-binding protein [Blastopirellula marina]|uniref:Peptide ABC transporter substrate-binding protein n=1 Tax=Blastopirellula marina TaxID=124 RepID=A0A2S8F0J3_9BACT|nr:MULTISPECIES: ABC transporter substrate-binding protein [Pirellulaceae]PQO25653.1 peptide ABC transporter substrate-binding protein [Blastopirellula marina]RCS43336.1 ABC transporter substrate-binding protein [Bremerella cremea]